jgi:hypothetical protein
MSKKMANKDLTNKDYISILKFYKQPIPKSKQLIKRKAETIMSEKLCRCIKKLEPIYAVKAIPICSKSIFNNKGLSRGKFTCSGKRTAKISKSSKNNTRKR